MYITHQENSFAELREQLFHRIAVKALRTTSATTLGSQSIEDAFFILLGLQAPYKPNSGIG
ncbi:MAG: hypothetical protein BWY75_01794 [bacterium ADurb.Bin425]|nr:MAG: hypothetical protein BWY75_01794 [bacterium ADurb.Bin425]